VTTKYPLLLAVLALLALAGCAGSELVGAGPTATAGGTGAPINESVEVVSVVDGDTVDIRYQNGTSERIRLLGVDTPEVHTAVSPGEFEGVPNTTAGRDCLRTHGERATEFATERLAGETVTLRTDPTADRRGSYGRLLAYVVGNGTNFNRELVATGHARVYDSEFRYLENFTALEEQARAEGRGLWACAG
jgi:micrococcal nuclease